MFCLIQSCPNNINKVLGGFLDLGLPESRLYVTDSLYLN